MSPAPLHPKREITDALCQPSLKINKDSHFIKKTSSSLSSPSSTALVNRVTATAAAASNKPQQRLPVIIYTDSPKVIHTHPRDFMALVQKLTGLSRSEDDGGGGGGCSPPHHQQQPKQEPGEDVAAPAPEKEGRCMKVVVGNEDINDETSSVITDEDIKCSSSKMDDDKQLVMKSCFMAAPPILEPPLKPYVTNFPLFGPYSQLLNYADPLFFFVT